LVIKFIIYLVYSYIKIHLKNKLLKVYLYKKFYFTFIVKLIANNIFIFSDTHFLFVFYNSGVTVPSGPNPGTTGLSYDIDGIVGRISNP